MKYLLDTSIFLWMIDEPEKLSPKAQRVLSAVGSELYLSVASSWEIVIKVGTGRLTLEDTPVIYVPRWQSNYKINTLNISNPHALAVWSLPHHYEDPVDRMLIAQAQIEEMVLLTSDRAMTEYPVKTFWCGR